MGLWYFGLLVCLRISGLVLSLFLCVGCWFVLRCLVVGLCMLILVLVWGGFTVAVCLCVCIGDFCGLGARLLKVVWVTVW